MKLYKALKLRKKLVGEITKLKEQIKEKNSYLVGSINGQNFDVNKLYEELQEKINTLVNLKYFINEANREVQSNIYLLSEYKALITFWNEVPVTEGTQTVGYAKERTMDYNVHINEQKRNEIVNGFQIKVDALQEELDIFNYNTEIPWDAVIEDTPKD